MFGEISWQVPGKTKFRTWQNMAIKFTKIILVNFFLNFANIFVDFLKKKGREYEIKKEQFHGF